MHRLFHALGNVDWKQRKFQPMQCLSISQRHCILNAGGSVSDYRIKHGRRTNFTTFSNEIFDAEIPMDTGFLYMFLLSLPENWILNAKHIQNKFGVGKQKAYRMINDLIEIGLVDRIDIRNEKGQFICRQYIIHSTMPNSEDGKPYPENQDMGNQDTYKELSVQSTKGIYGKKRKAKKLDANWELSEGDVQFAKSNGWDNRRIKNEHQNFIEHFTNGNGRNKARVNWSLSWQTWVRNDYNSQNGKKQKVPTSELSIAKPKPEMTLDELFGGTQ